MQENINKVLYVIEKKQQVDTKRNGWVKSICLLGGEWSVKSFKHFLTS